MSDEVIGQNDIEQLLQQAQGTALSSPGNVAGSGAAPTPVRQDESDALHKGMNPGAGKSPPGSRPVAAQPPVGGAAAVAPSTRPGPSSAGRTGDDVQFLLDQAEQAIASINQPSEVPSGAAPFQFRDLSGSPPSPDKASLDLLRDVELDLRIELGRTQMELEEVLMLRRGSVVTLDKLAGDPVDVYVNGRLIARGEVLVLNDNFCVRVAELVTGDDL